MKKQKLLALGLSLLAVAMVGGTSAFFVTSDRAHNVITTSGVAIELIEDTNQTGVDGRPIPFTNIEDAHPGDSYSKIPQVKNVDEGEVWVRIKVGRGAKLDNGDEITIDIPNRAISAKLSKAEIARRRKALKPWTPRIKGGWLERYARFVGNASTGASLKGGVAR